MSKTAVLWEKLKKTRLIALLNPQNDAECVTAYETLDPEGVVLEIAFRSPFAATGIKAVLEKYPDAVLLAGTVMTRNQAESAITAGAAGIVSADFIPEVVEVCVDQNIMCIPGGISDLGKQLVYKAARYKCSLEELKEKYPYQWTYKLFPAFSGIHSHIDLPTAWRGPFKDVTVIYTGGIDLNTLAVAARKDPQGIFCASALTRSIFEPKKMLSDIRCWKKVLTEGKAAVPPVVRTSIPAGAGEIITCGEMMMRLSPSSGIRLEQADNFTVHFGGAEANVAVSLARFGEKVSFISALPNNTIGDNAVNTLKFHGVDTSFVIRKGSRIGIYYLEHGSGPRPSKVIYDRKCSAAAQLQPHDLDWQAIFTEADWFHWTGITPALSDSMAETLQEGIQTARKKGVRISVDLNYRAKLWQEDKAGRVMSRLMPMVDICIGNEEDPMRIFGIKPSGTDVEKGKLALADYKAMAEELIDRFSFKKVAFTLRESISASENIWSACLFNGKDFYHSRKYKVWITDRVGSGDAFAAGLIFRLRQGDSDQEALDFGVAAACLKHSIWGDFNLVNRAEVQQLLDSGGSGRVLR